MRKTGTTRRVRLCVRAGRMGACHEHIQTNGQFGAASTWARSTSSLPPGGHSSKSQQVATWPPLAGGPGQRAPGTPGNAGRRIQGRIGPAAAAFGSPRYFWARSCRASRVPSGCLEEYVH